jgi:hypothetical protein
MASFLYRGVHGGFIGTKTTTIKGISERIIGNFTAFGPENYGGVKLENSVCFFQIGKREISSDLIIVNKILKRGSLQKYNIGEKECEND